MTKSLVTKKETKLAYKLNVRCSCGSLAEYSMDGDLFCSKCFNALRAELKKEEIDIIFPSYYKPSYPKNFTTNFMATLGKTTHKRKNKKKGGKKVKTPFEFPRLF